MEKPDRKALENNAREKFERLLPLMIERLEMFVDNPMAKTLLESEKGLNAILKKMGDEIISDAFTGTAESKEFITAVVAAAKKNTGCTTCEEKLQSSSSTGKP